jgi:catechol 2,3-dioxygenase-like lactoylglutathione lyase family enzyme
METIPAGADKTMKARWTHLALHVRNLQGSIAFYERFTNLRVIDRHCDASSTGMEVVWLGDLPASDENGFVLVLQEGTPRSIPGAKPQSLLGRSLILDLRYRRERPWMPSSPSQKMRACCSLAPLF